jgi:hypothetical protein
MNNPASSISPTCDHRSSTMVPLAQQEQQQQGSISDEHRAEQLVWHALEAVDGDDKSAALHAWQVCPELVRAESEPLQFLQVEEYDAHAAAKRFALYWNHRKLCFGPDRAYLPMHMIDGTGALNMADIEAFRTCCFMPLSEDMMGRSVVFFDKVDLDERIPDQGTRARCAFYAVQVLSESPSSVQRGLRMLILQRNGSQYRKAAETFLEAVTQALPVKFIGVHVICVEPNERNNDLNLAQYVANFSHLLGVDVASKQSQLVTTSSLEALRLKMIVGLGFCVEKLPKQIGGTMTKADCQRWIEDRFSLEIWRHRPYQRFSERAAAAPQLLSLRASSLSANPQHAFASVLPSYLEPRPLLSNTQIADYMQQRQRQEQEQKHRSKATSAILEILETQMQLRQAFRPGSFCPAPQHLSLPNNLLSHLHHLSTSQSLQTSIAASALPTITGPLTGTDAAAFAVLSSSAKQLPSLLDQQPLLGANDASRKTKHDECSDRNKKSKATPVATMAASCSITAFATKSFEEALAMIPDYEKQAYLEAVQKVPHLVQKESDPSRFLIVEDHNAWSAARRFVQYWQLRKELFRERCFLPMTQTGNGALTPEDVLCLSCGADVVLPKDKTGCPIVCGDRSRSIDAQKSSDTLWRARTLFYLLQVLSEDKVSQEKGVATLNLAVTPRVTKLRMDVVKKRHEVVRVMPIKLKNVHVVVYPPKNGKRSLVNELISIAVHLAQQLVGKRAVIHMGETQEQFLTKLEQYGISQKGVPQTLGGDWKYEEFTLWQRRRSQYEHNGTYETRGRCVVAKAKESKLSPKTDDQDLEKARSDRKRRMNIIFSRQKRERRKTEVDKMKQSCVQLKRENECLKAEERRLLALLEETKCKVAKLEK